MTASYPIVHSEKPGDAHIDVIEVFSALSNPIRLRIIEELERQGLIPFGRFKQLLDIDNESTLNTHLDRLAKTRLIRKSPHVNAWELTEEGSKLFNLIKALKDEAKYSVGPMIKIIMSGSIPFTSLSEVEALLRGRKALEIVARTQDSISIKLDEPGTDISLEARNNGQFTATTRIPLTSVLSVTRASALREVEEQFVHFFNLIPDESSEQTNVGVESFSKVPSWILMTNGLLWSMVYFLFRSAISVNPEAALTSVRYWASMEY